MLSYNKEKFSSEAKADDSSVLLRVEDGNVLLSQKKIEDLFANIHIANILRRGNYRRIQALRNP